MCVECVAANLLVEQFLVLSSQLEQLKVEWWLKLLDSHIICTTKQHCDMEDAYSDRVLTWARKTLARKMSRETLKKPDEVRVCAWCVICVCMW